MGYQYLDMEEYRRKDHFAYFSGLAYPYVGVTVNADIIPDCRKISRKNSFHFF